MAYDPNDDKFDSILWQQFKERFAEARYKYTTGSAPNKVDADNAFSSTYACVGAPYLDRTAALNVRVVSAASIEAHLQPEGLVAIAGHCMAAAQIIHERRAAAQVEHTNTEQQ